MAIPRLALAERLIVKQIKVFIDAAFADPTVFDVLFDEDLSATELQEFKDYYAALEDVPVLHAYPRIDTRMPMIHVIPGNEKVSHPSVGNHVLEELNETGTQLERTKGEYWEQNFNCTIWTKEPTTTLLLHHYIRVALVTSLDFFNSEGMLDILINGTPLHAHTEFSPNLIVSRGFNLSCKTLIPHTNILTDFIDEVTVTEIININDPC